VHSVKTLFEVGWRNWLHKTKQHVFNTLMLLIGQQNGKQKMFSWRRLGDHCQPWINVENWNARASVEEINQQIAAMAR